MPLSSTLDTYLRQSPLARFIPQLRQRTPRLYNVARSAVNRVLPMGSETQSDLARHHARALDRFRREVPITPDTVLLEIGSDSQGRVVRELAAAGAARVVGINPDFAENPPIDASGPLPASCALTSGDARNMDFPDESFDAVFSCAVFEHLLDFDRCLDEMYRVLVPGGYVFALFGPIWSCSIGHHVKAFGDGLEARHYRPETNPIPNHGHLLHDRAGLERVLRTRGVPPNLLRSILDWTYESSEINRLFYEDFVRSMKSSPFELIFLEPEEEHVSRSTLAVLKSRYPGYERFDVRNASVLLRKPLKTNSGFSAGEN